MQTFLITVTLIFLLLQLLVAAYNYYSSPTLIPQQCDNTSLISILVPARNEASNLPGLINSILAQNLANIEIIVLDDHSSDDTRAVAEAIALLNKQVRVIQGKPLPEGWTGKNFACHQLALEASGSHLLFLDADVLLDQSAIESAVGRMDKKQLSLLSLFPQQQTLTLGEMITVPLMNYLLLTLLPLKLIESHTDPIFSAACGQFMLFRASSYHYHQWHKQARGIVSEDLAIMKMLKQNGEKGEGLLCGDLVRCRMYTDFQTATQGFSKNFIAPFNNSIPVFLLFILVVSFCPLLIMFAGNKWEILAMVSLIAGTRLLTNKLSGQPASHILLHPLQLLSLSYIAVTSINQRLNRSTMWKGRSIPIDSAPTFIGKPRQTAKQVT